MSMHTFVSKVGFRHLLPIINCPVYLLLVALPDLAPSGPDGLIVCPGSLSAQIVVALNLPAMLVALPLGTLPRDTHSDQIGVLIYVLPCLVTLFWYGVGRYVDSVVARPAFSSRLRTILILEAAIGVLVIALMSVELLPEARLLGWISILLWLAFGLALILTRARKLKAPT